MRFNMKAIKKVIQDIEHIPKCLRSGDLNLYYLIKQNINGKNKDNKT